MKNTRMLAGFISIAASALLFLFLPKYLKYDAVLIGYALLQFSLLLWIVFGKKAKTG